MPLTAKGRKIKTAMIRQYGDKKGEQVFYASENKGTIKGIAKRRKKKKHDDYRRQMQPKAHMA